MSFLPHLMSPCLELIKEAWSEEATMSTRMVGWYYHQEVVLARVLPGMGDLNMG